MLAHAGTIRYHGMGWNCMAARLPMEKLKLLYLMERARSPLSREDLWEFCEPWLPYFSLQSAMNELFDQGLIEGSAVFTTERRYQMAEPGMRTLHELEWEIPLSQRKRLDEDAQRMREKARNAVMYLSNYHKMDPGQYVAELRIVECGIILLQLNVNLPTMEQADALCKRWTQAAPEVYADLLRYADPQQEAPEQAD